MKYDTKYMVFLVGHPCLRTFSPSSPLAGEKGVAARLARIAA